MKKRGFMTPGRQGISNFFTHLNLFRVGPRSLSGFALVARVLLWSACVALVVDLILPCETDRLIWIPRDRSADALYRFIEDGRAGYINGSGEVVVKPTLETYGNSGEEFHDGLRRMRDGIYIDASGKRVIDLPLQITWEFSEGLAVAMGELDGERRWGYIDTTGEFAIPLQFPESPRVFVSSFSEGLAAVRIDKWFGYIDTSGSFVIRPQFAHAEEFQDGIARVPGSPS